MKAIDLLINSSLPPALRDPNRVLDKKGVEALLAQVARKYPDRYSEIVQNLGDVGRRAAYLQGETLGLNDLKPVLDKKKILEQMDAETEPIDQSDLDDKAKAEAKQKIWGRYADSLEKDTATAAAASGNQLGANVASGARGNPFHLKSMLTTPALYTDHKDRIIPVFIRHSFSEGLRPAEYLASSFGVRKATVATKGATAKAGDLLKQLMAANATAVVTQDDCGTSNGLNYSMDDSADLEGRVTTKDYPGVPAGTTLDRTTLTALRSKGLKQIMVRSPMTCQSKNGICAHCLGQLANGHWAAKGYQAGITAGEALGEPAAQSSLGTKHGAGAFKGKKSFAGFPVINQLLQSPEVFPDRAAVAEEPGRVQRIEEAPQGGKYVMVGEKQHYVLPGYDVTVKPGDEVEAGDQLSDGIIDPSDLVRLRGLGEGRKYLADRLRQAYEESGYGKPSRTNLEIVARSILNHVQVNDPEGLGDYLPDDTASYNSVASGYTPPEDTKLAPVKAATGQYLQTPALHFTIGTKLTPKMTAELERGGVSQVATSKEEPRFTPEMVRLRASSHNNPDWLARMSSNYLQSGLIESAERAKDTNLAENSHWAPRLMVGKDFGKKVEQTGKF